MVWVRKEQKTFALMNSSLPQKQCAPDLRKEKKLIPKIIKLLLKIKLFPLSHDIWHLHNKVEADQSSAACDGHSINGFSRPLVRLW